MPIAARGNVILAAGASNTPDLGVYDRMGGNGGRVRVRAVIDSAGVSGDIVHTLFVGSEMVENRGGLGLERSAGAGVDDFTPSTGSLGAPGDKIASTFTNISAASRTVRFIIEVENA